MLSELSLSLRSLDADAPSQLITVRETDTWERVLTLMLDSHVHREFLVDNHQKALKCICLRDVLLALLIKKPEA